MAANCFRKGLKILENAPDNDEEGELAIELLRDMGQWISKGRPKSHYSIETIRQKLLLDIKLLENLGNGTEHNLPPTMPELGKRLNVGGNSCDFCRRTFHELEIETLLTCGRCALMYYCSYDCQKKAWKSGHKKACRHKNEVKAGDHMRVVWPSQHRLAPAVVEILAEEKEIAGERCFVAKNVASETIFRVHLSNLRHLRPCK